MKAEITLANQFGKHQIIFTIDREGILSKLSPAWYLHTGFSTKKSIGNSLSNYIYSEDQKIFQLFLDNLNHQRDNSEPFIIRLKNRSGKLRSFEIRLLSVSKSRYTCLLYNVNSYVESNQELAKSEEWFRMMYTHAPLSYHSLDENGYILAVNRTWCQTLGYSEKEVTGKWIGNFMTESSIPVLKKNFPLFKQRGHVDGVTFTMLKKDGTPVDIELYGLIGYNQSGAFKQTHCAFRNITQERFAQLALARSEARFRKLFETAMDGIFIADNKGQFVDVNKAGLKLLGFERKELLKLSIKDIIPVEAHADQKKRLADVLKGKTFTFERVYKRKDGSLFPGEVSIRNLNDEKVIGLVRDISIRKLQEKQLKSERDKLRKSEALLHAILDSPKGLIVFSLDRSYKYTAFTDSHKKEMKQIWGIDIKTGMNILKVISNPDDRKRAKLNFDKTLEGDFLLLEEVYGDNNLKRIYYENHYSPIYDDKHKIIGLSVFVIDITKRKHTEQKIIDQNILLQKIAENYPNSYLSVIEKDYTVGFTAGREFEKQGLNPADYIGLPIEEVFGENAPFIKEKYQNTFKGAEEIFELEINGQYQLYRTVPLQLANGKINRILSVVENISERKESELALKASDAFSKSLLRTIPLGIDIVDEHGSILFASEIMQQKFGPDIKGGKCWSIYKEDQKQCEECPLKSGIHIGETATIETDNVMGGKSYEISHTGMIFKGRKAILETFQDISERKHAEQALLESEHKYRSLFEHSADALLIIEGYEFVDCNDATLRMLGYKKRNEFLKTHPSRLSPKKQADGESSLHKANEMMDLAYKNGSHRFEWIHTRKNGENFPVEVLLTSVPRGNEHFLHVVWRDITERKKAEEALIQTTHDLLNSQKVARIGSYVFDIASGSWTSSKILDEIFDIPADYHKNIPNWLEIIHPDDREMMKDYFIHDVLGKNKAFNKEYRIVKLQSGIIRWVHGIGKLYYDKQGKPLKIIGTVQDITDKKEQNLRLEANEKYLRSILNSEPECVKILDKEGKILEINPAGLAMLEVESAGQVINISIFDFLLPAYKSAFKKMFDKVVLKGKSQMLVFEIEGLKGTRRWLETHSVPYYDYHGNITGLLGVTRDITERKILEIKNKEVQEEIRLSLQDKEVLLKELYHRTKNNMQVMVGLLSLQMQQIDNKEAIEILREAKNRIFSMSMVHEHLHQSKNLSKINFKNYLITMINSIVSGYEHLAKNMHIEYNMEDIFLNISAAIPCALIVNEIITNAMKYAFPDNQLGKIVVTLKALKQNGFMLKIADNGIGFPKTFDWRHTKSLGMWIIVHLTEDQLKGKVKMHSIAGKGTAFTLTVPGSATLSTN